MTTIQTGNVSTNTNGDAKASPELAAAIGDRVKKLVAHLDGTRSIPLGELRPSKFNPRKTFDESKLAELARSISEVGVLEDLLVRPVDKAKDGTQWEIVFGERRYRAAKIAGVSHVPCKVRELTDAAALELAIVENTQREDVDPLEEAEGFELLHKPKKEGGLGISVEEIAAKIGKSTAHVYQRLKMCELGPEGRKAYREGILTSYTAMIVARIPHRDLQKRAIEWARGYRDVSAREFAAYIRRTFMLDLARAPFDKKSLTLYPEAGACDTCPNRTGNQIRLFGDAGAADGKDRDVCTDPKCYEIKAKKGAAEELAARAAKGASVLDPKQTKRIFGSTSSDYVHPSTGFVSIDSNCDEPGLHQKKWSGLLRGLEVKRHVAAAPNGRVVELVKVSEATKAIKDAGILKHAATGTAANRTHAADAAARAAKAKLRNEVTRRALGKIAEAAEKKTPAEKALWMFLAIAFTENAAHDTLTKIAARRGLKDAHGGAPAVKHAIKDMNANELRAHVVELAASVGAWMGSWNEEAIGGNVKRAGELLGIDLTKIAGEVKAEKKEKKVAKKAAKKAAPKKDARAKELEGLKRRTAKAKARFAKKAAKR